MMRSIDRMPLSILFLIVCASLLLFAGFYWALGRYDQGLIEGGHAVSFGNCVYFSVITFSSLGYGDVLPREFSKVVASIEVLVGLAFLGIFISKLSSSKQSFHLAQLYARDAQERLDDFAIILEGHRVMCKETLETLKGGTRLERALNRVQTDVYVTTLRIRAYVSFEIGNGDFLLETPIGAPARLAKKSTQLVGWVSALSCFPSSLHSQKQRRIAKRTIQVLAGIAKMMNENSEDLALKSETTKLIRKCEAAEKAIDMKYIEVADKFRQRPIQ
jgi:hypothetical protein